MFTRPLGQQKVGQTRSVTFTRCRQVRNAAQLYLMPGLCRYRGGPGNCANPPEQTNECRSAMNE